MKKIISKFYNYLANDSLYRNSIFLMLSTGVMAVFGFFFWIINARLYSADQVGIGATLISVMTLISSFSILGLGNGLIRYLPTSKRKNKKINTSFTLVALMSILISVIYLLFLKNFSPILLFVRENIIFSLLFILFVVISSLSIISENIFIAYRSSQFMLIKNTIFSIVKLIFPLLLLSLGAYGIFMSVGIASIVAFLFVLAILTLRFNYLLKPIIDVSVIKKMVKFSLGNYAAELMGGLPNLALPILITNLIGAKFSAYYYMAVMIAGLLYVIPMATSQSLFAEGSYNEKELRLHVKKATTIIALILIPAIIIIVFLGKYILLAFGKDYSSEGFRLLQVFAMSGVFIAAKNVCGIVLKVKNKIKEIVFVDMITALSILGLSYFLMPIYFLKGIEIAWVVGHALSAGIFLIVTKKSF
ncbi:MAG TPA: oligosaccharide flippase family protein [Atribacterota bacterium]|nr:oligosaccharide flippase family protein [Atribacterota bacterium]